MELIFALGIILIVGYFFGLIAEKLSFPRVSAYLMAGILFSESLLGTIVNLKLELWSSIFSQVCLGFIAYIIGSEMNLKNLKAHSREIFLATLCESILPAILVFISISLLCTYLNFPFYLSLVLASISCTTAPAATIAIIEQYKAKGKMTDTTLSIVALDDAFGIFVFILVSSIFFPAEETGSLLSFLKEISLSVAIGLFFGFALSKFAKFSISNDFLFPLLTGLVLLIVSLADTFHFSSLLSLIILGVVANSSNIQSDEKLSLLLPIQHIEELVFILFFTFAGVHFSPHYFMQATAFIFTYVLARAIGKYFGVMLGIKLGDPSEKKMSRYIGFTLLPQAGVAIGLLFQALQYPSISEYSELLLNIILGSTILYELVGPFFAKYAFQKMQEIQ